MDIINFLVEPYLSYSTSQIALEITAVIFGILSVYFSSKNSILVFPTGLISTGIYVYLLINWGLYGDLLINTYYFIMSIFGWYNWLRPSYSEVLPIKNWNAKDRWISLMIFFSSIFLVASIYYYRPIIDSGFDFSKTPNFNFSWIDYADCINTAIFFAGMWLMAERKVQNWHFWIIGNSITVPLYLAKGYGITALQYVIFIIIAFYGLRNWQRILKTKTV